MKNKKKLKKVFVEELFGSFDYSIDFFENNRDKEGITIITAPNGYGKSTILRLISDFLGGRYVQLARSAFTSIVIEMTDGQGVMVQRNPILGEQGDDGIELCITRLIHGKTASKSSTGIPWKIRISSPVNTEIDDEYGVNGSSPHSYIGMERTVERELGLRRIGLNMWRDTNDGRTYNREQFATLLEDHQAGGSRNRKSEPEWLKNFRADLPVLYISANRLRGIFRTTAPGRGRFNESGDSVEVISERVLNQIRAFNAKYARIGRELEQDFPSRVIEAIGSKQKIEQKEILKLMEEVRKRESEYQEFGLLNEVQTRDVNLAIKDPSALLVLGIYLQDIQWKLEAVKETVDRLKIFIETLNSMLLFKKLEVANDIGFRLSGHDNKNIPLRSLSSGEQHLIVLLGQIIFDSVENSLVLLDEPEISFHPEWQEQFPDVLAKVVELNACTIVMATHSPTLIKDKWDSVVELADQVQP